MGDGKRVGESDGDAHGVMNLPLCDFYFFCYLISFVS